MDIFGATLLVLWMGGGGGGFAGASGSKRCLVDVAPRRQRVRFTTEPSAGLLMSHIFPPPYTGPPLGMVIQCDFPADNTVSKILPYSSLRNTIGASHAIQEMSGILDFPRSSFLVGGRWKHRALVFVPDLRNSQHRGVSDQLSRRRALFIICTHRLSLRIRLINLRAVLGLSQICTECLPKLGCLRPFLIWDRRCRGCRLYLRFPLRSVLILHIHVAIGTFPTLLTLGLWGFANVHILSRRKSPVAIYDLVDSGLVWGASWGKCSRPKRSKISTKQKKPF